jgi:hypothetical protein
LTPTVANSKYQKELNNMCRKREQSGAKQLALALLCCVGAALTLLPLTTDRTLARWAADIPVVAVTTTSTELSAGQLEIELKQEKWIWVRTSPSDPEVNFPNLGGKVTVRQPFDPTKEILSPGDTIRGIYLLEVGENSVFVGEHLRAEVRQVVSSAAPSDSNVDQDKEPWNADDELVVTAGLSNSCALIAKLRFAEELNSSGKPNLPIIDGNPNEYFEPYECTVSNSFKADPNAANVLMVDVWWAPRVKKAASSTLVDLGTYVIDIVQFR